MLCNRCNNYAELGLIKFNVCNANFEATIYAHDHNEAWDILQEKFKEDGRESYISDAMMWGKNKIQRGIEISYRDSLDKNDLLEGDI
jgi:hypothetical protein